MIYKTHDISMCLGGPGVAGRCNGRVRPGGGGRRICDHRDNLQQMCQVCRIKKNQMCIEDLVKGGGFFFVLKYRQNWKIVEDIFYKQF